ncbi:DNA adenine methylase [Roseibium aggregatum]|uniref:DNA adenine methylase n=1 Tax=Roseibium aggregatum TaxID=187304 RepID=UPI0025ABB8D5|nr:DNA adenine methylase [Roseibium aggregatum]WJS05496.1 DNA adenine methylase [Roseibium aggregatum]
MTIATASIHPDQECLTRQFPQQIKYMGSKAKIIDFVADSIASVYQGGAVCDLFSGSASLSGALGATYPIVSNDIQHYSAILASVYLREIGSIDIDDLQRDAFVNQRKAQNLIPVELQYAGFGTLEEFQEIEKLNQTLIHENFRHRYHLFLKNYSGTWWSAEQCSWIDAIKQAIDKRRKSGAWGDAEYALAMASLMHAMAYSSQGTGHYAQYRDAKTEASMRDINIYRQKRLQDLFFRKLNQMQIWVQENVVDLNHSIVTKDYQDCLKGIDAGTVYADPPYAFVHYSRFYHAMETLCLYDYPELQEKGGSIVKGRYRGDRHQSPFCIRTQVDEAFRSLFNGVLQSNSCLALSYSNTAMITLEKLIFLAEECLGAKYKIWVEDQDHKHMTMGRSNDRDRDVKEIMLLARKK